jgi:putative phosphonate metabolism protein
VKRYAVYFAPEPGSQLERFGAEWLGRDARSGEAVAQIACPAIGAERLIALTAAPREYGFHATLKPPFALAAGRRLDELENAFVAFARECTAFYAPPLELAEVGRFLALVPSAPCPELDALAERAVRFFDAFRAAPSHAELVRRRHASLDARESELLDAWGYPYVLDRWRFHLTLTERLDSSERTLLRAALEPMVAPLCRTELRIDAVTLFVQPGIDEPFREHARFVFGHAGGVMEAR